MLKIINMNQLREIRERNPETIAAWEHRHPFIISCQISGGNLVSQIEDGREIIMPVNLLTKWRVLGKDVKPEQLKKYELQNEGRYIYFPEIDEILPSRKITEGLFNTCCCGRDK